MNEIRFPRIGGGSSVFDAVTVTYRNGGYVATARRDDIRATVSTSYDGAAQNEMTHSEMATDAAWRARVRMAEKWRDHGFKIAETHPADSAEWLRENTLRTFEEWTDSTRYVVVVSAEVPEYGYVVTFIPRELVEEG